MKLVRIFTKTYCPYSKRAKALLSDQGVCYEEIDVTEDTGKQEEMSRLSRGQTTVPQVFIAGEHVGGCTDLEKLASEGRLETMLAD